MSSVINKVTKGVYGVKNRLDEELQETTDVFTGENVYMGGKYAEERVQEMTPEQFSKVSEKREKNIHWTYCLVFPYTTSSNAGGVKGFVMSKLDKNYGKSADDLTIAREKIIAALREASFHIRLFKSSDGSKLICKVGATDARLLEVAEANEYLLRLNEASVKKVLETEETLPNGDKRLPIYLDYPYKDAELKAKLLPNFKAIGPLGDTSVSMSIIARKVKEQTRMSPFAKLHIRYSSKAEERIVQDHNVQIYKRYGTSILRTFDRIRLTQMSIESPKVAIKGNKGAGLDLKKLQFDGILLASYPVSYNETISESRELTVDQLYDKWSTTFHRPWSQPIDDIRDYAGEKIALYFAFLGFYTLWLIPAALVGLIVFVHQLYELNDKAGTFNFVTANTGIKILNNSITGEPILIPIRPTEVPELPYYTLFIALWGTFLLEFWKRNQASLSLNWGTSNYERLAVVRPEFTPTFVLPNVVTGLPELYRSPVIFGAKLTVSFTTVFTFVVAVIAAIFGTLVFKETVSQLGLPEAIAPQVALVVNAVLIILLGQVFKRVAKFLTDWENHRTDIEYEDSLIAKTFLFSFFNSYSTLMYYAFIKSGRPIIPNGRTQFCIADIQTEAEREVPRFNESELIDADSCYGAVGYSLFILFGVQIFVSNSIEVGLPFIQNQFKSYSNRAARKARQVQDAAENLTFKREPNEEKDEEPMEANDEELRREKLVSPAEQQFFLADYETPFEDYLEIALQFGYVTLFVSAFPLAPVFALIACYIEFRVDSSKICFLSRKPDLSSAQDIGQWLTIFTILSFISVLVNSGILLFTVKEPIVTAAPSDSAERVWIFVAFIAAVYIIKLITDYFVPDVPISVKLQLQRQAHIEKKVFDQEPDEEKELVLDENVDSTQKDEEEIADEEYLQNPTDIEPYDPLITFMLTHVREVLHQGGKKEEDLKALSEMIFKKADLNKDQELSLKELRKMLRSPEYGAPLASMSKFEVALLMNAMDINGDGAISRDEFETFMFGHTLDEV